jgi:hypothetical protein
MTVKGKLNNFNSNNSWLQLYVCARNFATSFPSVVDTGGKFAAGVVDTGGAPLPSPRIFEKIRNGPNGILWGWGETDS